MSVINLNILSVFLCYHDDLLLLFNQKFLLKLYRYQWIKAVDVHINLKKYVNNLMTMKILFAPND